MLPELFIAFVILLVILGVTALAKLVGAALISAAAFALSYSRPLVLLGLVDG